MAPLRSWRPCWRRSLSTPTALYLSGVCCFIEVDRRGRGNISKGDRNRNRLFAPAHLQLGMCYQQKEMPDKALESYKRRWSWIHKILPQPTTRA